MEEHYNQEFKKTDCENNAELPQNESTTKEIFSKPVLIGIIAAFVVLVIVLLLVILVPKNDSGNVNENEQDNGGASESGEVSNEAQVKTAVLVAISRELMFYNYDRSDDDKLYLRQTLYNSIQALDQYGLEYKVYGKQKFADAYGTIYIANFSAEVVYDSSTSSYLAGVEIGTLYRE